MGRILGFCVGKGDGWVQFTPKGASSCDMSRCAPKERIDPMKDTDTVKLTL
uniref:Uncharacterized protein n=1 Tax=Peronospora matthiolae TaxID=2874970 RepID=A0AAV1USS2_9STRA